MDAFIPAFMKQTGFLLLNLLVLVAFSWVAFSDHPQVLFNGTDGAMVVEVAHEQMRYFGHSVTFNSSMLEGLGDLTVGVNLSQIPAFWVPHYDPATGFYYPVLPYIGFALIFFLSMLIIGWNYGFARGQIYLATWATTLLFFPYMLHHRIYPITELAPQTAFMFLSVAVLDIAFWRSGRGPWYHDVGHVFLVLLSVGLMLIALPLAAIFMVPYRLASVISAVAAAENRTQRLRKLAVIGAAAAAILLLGWVKYEFGFVLYSAAFQFKELVGAATPLWRGDASILFDGWIFQQSFADRTMGTYLFLAATIGAVIALCKSKGKLRVLAWNVLIFQTIIAGGGLAAATGMEHWVYPNPIYFEILYYPLYGLFAAYGLTQLVLRVVPKFSRTEYAFALLPLLLVIPVSIFYLKHDHAAPRAMAAIPAKASPLTNRLANDIAIHPNAPFAGRVVSMMAGKTFEEQEAYFFAFERATGNEHMHTGLWSQNIPTLVSYNQLISPYFFWFTKQFLQTKSGEQRRNWINFSVANIPVLRMLGLRYILSPDAAIAGATLVDTLPAKDMAPLNLFEIAEPNVRGFFATSIHSVPTMSQAKSAIAESLTRSNEAVVLEAQVASVPKNLVMGKSSAIEVTQGGWRITAQSDGASMLVVPFEYSQCLDVTANNGSALPSAVRVNGLLTGLVFDKTLDVTMATRVGIFHNPTCRFDDFSAFVQMRKIDLQPASLQ